MAIGRRRDDDDFEYAKGNTPEYRRRKLWIVDDGQEEDGRNKLVILEYEERNFLHFYKTVTNSNYQSVVVAFIANVYGPAVIIISTQIVIASPFPVSSPPVSLTEPSLFCTHSPYLNMWSTWAGWLTGSTPHLSPNCTG